MTAIPPDYDSDPARRQSWKAPHDVHHMIGPELRGPVLDVGCGEGRLASVLRDGVGWVGVDASPAQLATNPYRPAVLADMRALPFRDGVFAEVAHLWCLYHLDEPSVAISEAKRVLRTGGRYYASTGRATTTRRSSSRAMHRRLSMPRRPSRSWNRCSRRSNRNDGMRSSSRCRLATKYGRTAVTVSSPPKGPRGSISPLADQTGRTRPRHEGVIGVLLSMVPVGSRQGGGEPSQTGADQCNQHAHREIPPARAGAGRSPSGRPRDADGRPGPGALETEGGGGRSHRPLRFQFGVAATARE